jgi:hypothetical protein
MPSLAHRSTNGSHILLDPVGAGQGVVDDQRYLHVSEPSLGHAAAGTPWPLTP